MACHQTNFSEGEFREEGTPLFILFFLLFLAHTLFALSPLFKGFPRQMEVHVSIQGR